MKNLLKADLYRMRKSRLTFVAMILVVAFPVLFVLLYAGINAMAAGLDPEMAEAQALISVNTVLGSAYSLTNNVGLVIPAFAGIMVCSDYSNGTLRNKVIAGNRRSHIYLSHLITSIIFAVGAITIYVVVTAALSMIFFKFDGASVDGVGREILYFIIYGTMSFVFMATVSTMLAMVLRNIAPTIIFTIVLAMILGAVNTILLLIDYEKYKYLVYLIPTFGSNFFNLQGMSLLGILAGTAENSRAVIFFEGLASYIFFGALNTVIGLLVFGKRDIS